MCIFRVTLSDWSSYSMDSCMFLIQYWISIRYLFYDSSSSCLHLIKIIAIQFLVASEFLILLFFFFQNNIYIYILSSPVDFFVQIILHDGSVLVNQRWFLTTCWLFLVLNVKHVDLLPVMEYQTVNKFCYYVLQLWMLPTSTWALRKAC